MEFAIGDIQFVEFVFTERNSETPRIRGSEFFENRDFRAVEFGLVELFFVDFRAVEFGKEEIVFAEGISETEKFRGSDSVLPSEFLSFLRNFFAETIFEFFCREKK